MNILFRSKKIMKYTKEFLKAQEDYLKAYHDCFIAFTHGECYGDSWNILQSRFSETLYYMQSFKEEYAQVLEEQAKEGKSKNPFFS
jgi:hypothetical protein